MIQERLQREYGVTISLGGIMGLLYRVVRAGTPTYRQLQADVRASAVVHADETGWRETGQHSQRVPCSVRRPAEAIWALSTAHTVYVHHGRRTNEEIDGILGANNGPPLSPTAMPPMTTSWDPSSAAGLIWCGIWMNSPVSRVRIPTR